jgi:hypothetical protein
MTGRGSHKARGFRRVERWLVGLALAVVAFVLERVVMRTIKKKPKPKPKPKPEPELERPISTMLTSKGGEVDIG